MKPLDLRAEESRLRVTIALAEAAIHEAANLRSARHAEGETAEDTRARWNEAADIEGAAVACRKACRKALARISGCVTSAPEDLPGWIEEAREAALALKATIDCHQQRKDLERFIAEEHSAKAAVEESRERAEDERRKGGAL